MLRWKLLLSATLVFNQAFAESITSAASTEARSACVECIPGKNTSNDALMRFAMEMNKITDGAIHIEVISDKMNYAEKCEKFADDGELNKWGAVINKELNNPKYETMLHDGARDITKYCPRYPDMAVPDKKALNVLIITAMAHYESSCNYRVKAPGPNGTAAGLLQLHKGREHRYSSGCQKNDSLNAERSLICGLSMLHDQLARGENLFSPRSYWEVLRPRGSSKRAHLIQSAIRKFPSCNQGMETKIGSTKPHKKNQVATR